VIVCTRNRAATLRRCLEHISKLEYPNFTVLVVDNGSKDLTAQIAQDAGADYLLVQQPGLSRARNAGVRHSSTEIVAFIDDDAVPYPAWLSKLVEFFDDPNVMAVGGHYQPFDDPVLPQGLAPLVLDKTNPEWLPIAAFGGIGDGCNMAFRRSAFSVWRGFDERMGRGAEIDGGEEHLGFATLTAKGYRCVFSSCRNGASRLQKRPEPASRDLPFLSGVRVDALQRIAGTALNANIPSFSFCARRRPYVETTSLRGSRIGYWGISDGKAEWIARRSPTFSRSLAAG
jgi:glycosyltransferase involved in cell wall biosynthesis